MKFLFISLFILTHSWYPPYCCAEKDCKEVPCSTIAHVGNTYKYTSDKTYEFQEGMHQFSPDGLCHVCMWTGYPKCIFTPAPVMG